MNGQQLVDLTVAKIVPITDADQVRNINTEFVLAMVNDAYREVERVEPWPWGEQEATLTTVVGQSEYLISSIDPLMRSVLHFYDPATHSRFQFLDERQDVQDYGTATGVPEAWSRWAETLRLFPTPSDVRDLTVRYYAAWEELTLITEPVFPATYHDMLTDGAAAAVALRLPPTGDRFLPGSRALPHREQFMRKLAAMSRDYLTLPTVDEVTNHAWDEYVTNGQDW